MAYTTTSNIRLISGLTTQDISDANITSLIALATTKLNEDISVEIIRERILQIDLVRRNLIDGSNTTYYVKNWKEYYIGDRDNDGDVDTSDIVVIQEVDNVETTLTVSSITPNDGKFVLSSAPASGVKLYVNYVYTPVSVSTPHDLIKQATNHMTSYLAFSRLDARKIQNFGIGRLKITKQSEAMKLHLDEYERLVNQIRRFQMHKSEAEKVTNLVFPSFELK